MGPRNRPHGNASPIASGTVYPKAENASNSWSATYRRATTCVNALPVSEPFPLCGKGSEGIQLALDEARSLNSPPKIVLLESPFNTLTSETMDMVFEGQFPGWPTEHAAIFETSVMLHLHPELVKWEKVVDDASERRPWYEILPIQPDLVAPSGTLWNATLASQEKGRLIWSEIVPQVREVIKMEFS